MADSVEKVALLLGLRQNLLIGQRERTQHDGTAIERTPEHDFPRPTGTSMNSQPRSHAAVRSQCVPRSTANMTPKPTSNPPKARSIQWRTANSRSRKVPAEKHIATRPNQAMCATETKAP